MPEENVNAALFSIEPLAMVACAIIITNNPLIFIADSAKNCEVLSTWYLYWKIIFNKQLRPDMSLKVT